MMCDGSGELRFGYLCRGCDNCLGLTTPIHTAPSRRPTPPAPITPCPACGTTVCVTDPWQQCSKKLAVAS